MGREKQAGSEPGMAVNGEKSKRGVLLIDGDVVCVCELCV